MFLTSFVPIRSFDSMTLSHGAERVLTTPNAGGNSEVSEALSFALLERMFGARLLCTEMEIDYRFMGGKITDYAVELAGTLIGVSVTRAMKFQGQFTEDDAVRLLTKKLTGVIWSTRNVSKRHRWRKQILHVWATSAEVARIVERVWLTLDDDLKANTVVMLTVAAGKRNRFIF